MDRLLIACAVLLLFVAAEQAVYPHKNPLRLNYGLPLDPQPPGGGGGGGGNAPPPPEQPPGQTGFPTATSTGPATAPTNQFAGTEFGATAFRIDTPGVYENFIFDRCVTIYADDVTIRNSIVNCRQGNYPAIWFRDGAKNGRVENTEINGIKVANQSPSAGIECHNACTATNNRIVGPQTGIIISTGSIAENNFIGQLRGSQTAAGNPSEHFGILATDADAVISHNTIYNDCDALLNTDDARGCDGAISTGASATTVDVEQNYIRQWQWTVFHVQSGTVTVSNNFFGTVGVHCIVTGGAVAATSTDCN